MSWYNPTTWFDTKGTITDANPGTTTPRPDGLGLDGWEGNANDTVYDRIKGHGEEAGYLADFGATSYKRLGREGEQLRGVLRGQMLGKDSLSAEQLRQGLQTNIAGQSAMARSASPGMAPMASRTAMMQAARMGQGLSGQQAMAGIAERKAAADSYANVLDAQRRADASVALGGRQIAMGGHQTAMDDATRRYGFQKGASGGPSDGDRAMQAAIAGGSILALASDRRLKQEIKDGDSEAKRFLKGLKSYTYKYKDSKFGEGKQLGIMAQDLERSGLGKQAVMNTSVGKMVHPGKLAGALAATLPHLEKRLSKLEGKD